MEKNITGLTDLFSKSIGIEEPWYIRSVETHENEVHIYVDVREGNMLPCPVCGEKCIRSGYEKGERVWRHGDCLYYPCYVHCRRPRIVCKEHKIKVVEAPWARKNSRFTLMFEGYAMLLLADMPRAKVAKILRCNEKSLVNMLHYWVSDAVGKDDLSKVRHISVDETSYKKGQSYVTIITDGKARRVIDVEEGRDSKTIDAFSKKLTKKGGDGAKIRTFSADLSAAYKMGMEENFPYAKLVADKFHVKKLALDAMDEVRKEEQKQFAKSRASGKRLLMIPESRQSDDGKKKLIELFKQYPKTGRAYRMVQALDEVYRCQSEQEAKSMMKRLISWMKKSRLQPMIKAAHTFQNRLEDILAYFISRVTNAIAEGLNSMIQAAKRKARGYRTYDGFSSMIYLIAAKLQLACPNPLRNWE